MGWIHLDNCRDHLAQLLKLSSRLIGSHRKRRLRRQLNIGVRMSLKPGLDLAPLFHGGPVAWFAVVSYLSTVTLCLGLAVVVMNRRELSYASSGN